MLTEGFDLWLCRWRTICLFLTSEIRVRNNDRFNFTPIVQHQKTKPRFTYTFSRIEARSFFFDSLYFPKPYISEHISDFGKSGFGILVHVPKHGFIWVDTRVPMECSSLFTVCKALIHYLLNILFYHFILLFWGKFIFKKSKNRVWFDFPNSRTWSGNIIYNILVIFSLGIMMEIEVDESFTDSKFQSWVNTFSRH